MSQSGAPVLMKAVIDFGGLSALLETLKAEGFALAGPSVKDNVIIYDEIDSAADLPKGYTDDQSGGKYRLTKSGNGAVFDYVLGHQSWKKFLYPPRVKLWSADREGAGFKIEPEKVEPRKTAFIGARPCELAAIAIQDKVFTNGAYVEPAYNARRANSFIVTVNCARPGGTCFCASMNTGPKALNNFDIAMTEIHANGAHYFVVEAGTELAVEIIKKIPHTQAGEHELNAADGVSATAAKNMGRAVNTSGLKELLYSNYDHAAWETVAKRCLSCANCTMVCPTCFCSNVEDVTDLTGNHAERWKKLDSCFTKDFSYIHGGSVRPSAMARYRHWMIHKMAAWVDQFGMFGCVGCGRCITWCPVGIDITEEAAAIRGSYEPPKGG